MKVGPMAGTMVGLSDGPMVVSTADWKAVWKVERWVIWMVFLLVELLVEHLVYLLVDWTVGGKASL